jgi:hypothetical protein
MKLYLTKFAVQSNFVTSITLGFTVADVHSLWWTARKERKLFYFQKMALMKVKRKVHIRIVESRVLIQNLIYINVKMVNHVMQVR